VIGGKRWRHYGRPVSWAGYFNGDVFSAGTYQGSDERLKTDIKDALYGLSQLGKLRSVTFRWKKGSTRPTQLGLIAQEVQKVIPEIVRTDGTTGMLAVNYTSLIPVTIKAVQAGLLAAGAAADSAQAQAAVRHLPGAGARARCNRASAATAENAATFTSVCKHFDRCRAPASGGIC